MTRSTSADMEDTARRLIVFHQYDQAGKLPPHVRIHLERIRPLATKLVLVSNSPLSQETVRDAHHVCDSIIVRENVGWDFSGWRDCILAEAMEDWDEVVLTNSSIVGPFFPLHRSFMEMTRRRCDFWGMTHSKEIRSHLQSFFLVFKRNAILSKAWSDFWYGLVDIGDKRHLIRTYEIGLSQALMKGGLICDSFIRDIPFPDSIRFVRINRLNRKVGVPFNVNYIDKSLELHREIIEKGMPYLKASLLWGAEKHRCEPIDTIKNIVGIDYPWSEIGL